MAKEWAPSWVGQHVTGSSDWRLRLEGLELALALDGRTYRAATQPLPLQEHRLSESGAVKFPPKVSVSVTRQSNERCLDDVKLGS